MLQIRMLDPQGNSRPRDELVTLYASDMNNQPFHRISEIKPDGTIHLTPQVNPVILHAKIHLTGYGFMWISSDNCGKGYKDGASLEFISESAVSRIFEVKQYLKSKKFRPSAKCLSLLTDAEYLISQANNKSENQEYFHIALANSMLAGEMAVVEYSRQIINSKGKRNDFLFGCGDFSFPGEKNPTLSQMFADTFNYTTLPFYLSQLEQKKDAPDYSHIDNLLASFSHYGIKCKGHPLWWTHKLHGIPSWAENLTWNDGSLKREIDRVISRSVKRYQGRIDIYDAINEAHDWCNLLNLTGDQQVMMSKWCCDAIHEADPSAKAVINSCFMFGENVADARVQYGPVYENQMTPYKYFEKLEEIDTKYEVLGIQLYCPSRDMLSIDKMFDRFKIFGKPIHLTELGVPSHQADVKLNADNDDLYCLRFMYSGLWREMGWTEKLQADWLEEFYTIAYAHDEVEALTWWNYRDPSYVPGSAIMHDNGQPKQAYFRLKAWQEAVADKAL